MADTQADGGALYVQGTTAGSASQQLTDAADGDQVWSPDGQYIAFRRTVSGTERQLWLMNADGSDQRLLTSGSVDEDPTWSPDKTMIAFTHDGTAGPSVFVLDLNDGSTRQLAGTEDGATAPAWPTR